MIKEGPVNTDLGIEINTGQKVNSEDELYAKQSTFLSLAPSLRNM
jgi:hypothetical protein